MTAAQERQQPQRYLFGISLDANAMGAEGQFQHRRREKIWQVVCEMAGRWNETIFAHAPLDGMEANSHDLIIECPQGFQTQLMPVLGAHDMQTLGDTHHYMTTCRTRRTGPLAKDSCRHAFAEATQENDIPCMNPLDPAKMLPGSVEYTIRATRAWGRVMINGPVDLERKGVNLLLKKPDEGATDDAKVLVFLKAIEDMKLCATIRRETPAISAPALPQHPLQPTR